MKDLEGATNDTAQKTSFLGRFKKDVNPLRQSRISKKNWAREVGTLVCLSVRCVCHLIFDFCSLDKEEVYLQCNESGHEQTESGLRFHPPLWAVKTNWVTLIYHLRETIFLPWFRSAQHHSPSRYVASARARAQKVPRCVQYDCQMPVQHKFRYLRLPNTGKVEHHVRSR